MKLIAAIVAAVCCLMVAGTATGGNSGASSGCLPAIVGFGGQAIYVYLEAIDRGVKNTSYSTDLRWYKPKGPVKAGLARGCGWTTNVYRAKRVPRRLCIVARDGWHSLLKGGECQRWHWETEGGIRRRVMVFRLIRG